MLTVAQEALKAPNARAITAVILRPTDPSDDGTEVVVPIADAVFTSSDTGTNRNLAFKNVIAAGQGMTLSESLTSQGKLTTTKSDFNAGRIIVDADSTMAALWPSLDWNGRPVEVFVGARYQADGQPMDLNDFDDFFDGIIDEVRGIGDGQFEITFADLRLNFEKKLSTRLYRGFGGGFQIIGLAPNEVILTQTHVAALDITSSLTLWWVGVVDTFRGSDLTPLITNGVLGPPLSVNYALVVDDSTEELAFVGGLSGGGTSQLVNSNYQITAGQPVVLAAVIDSDGVSLTFYAGTSGDDIAEVGTATLTNALGVPASAVHQMGISGGDDITAWEAHVFNSVKTLEELRELADAPVIDAPDRTDLIEGWRFSEGKVIGTGPEIVLGEKGVLDYTNGGAGTPNWVTTYEGDDPDLFPGSVAGKTRARVYGPASNVLLARIDTQRHVYGWDDVQASDLTRLRQRGVPMVVEQTLSASAVADFVFDATGNTVTINPAIGNFAKFIPGQFAPARLGQRIEVGGSGLNTGIYRVATAGVSADGLVMTLADQVVVNENAPADTTLSSYGPDVQYTLDLPRSVVVLNSEADGQITADIIGRLPVSGVARWSELFELITGVVPDTTDVTLDPVLGFSLPQNSSLKINQVLDEMARSAYGWWIETSAGGYRLGNFTPPSASPSEAVASAQILGVDPLRSFKPFWRYDIGYKKIWHTQQGDDLASSVSAADVQRFGAEFTFEPATNRSVLGPWPTATEHDSFETWLVELADAKAFKTLSQAMLSTKRDWFRLRFGNFSQLSIPLNGEISVTWEDDETLQLNDTPCKVVGREIDTGDYTMALEVHT